MTMPSFNYPSAVTPLYALRDETKQSELIDRLRNRLAHLSSLLIATYGASGDSFRDLGDTNQDNYLWACSDMADECRELAEQIIPSVNSIKAKREG